jgi:hypothetical protein
MQQITCEGARSNSVICEEMERAVDQARQALSHFWDALREGDAGQSDGGEMEDSVLFSALQVGRQYNSCESFGKDQVTHVHVHPLLS